MRCSTRCWARDLDSVERRLGRVGDAHDEAGRRLVEGFVLVCRRRWLQASAVFLSIPAAAIEAADQRTRFRVHVLRAWTRVVTGGSVDRARQELALVSAESAAEPCLSGYFGFASALATDARVTGSPARLAGGLELDDAWRGAAAAVGGLPDVAVRNLTPLIAQIDDGVVTMGDGEFHALLGYAHWLRAAPALWLLTLGMMNAAAGRPEAVHDLAALLASHPAPIGWREAGVAWLRGLGAESDGDLQEAARSLGTARSTGMAQLRIHAALLAADLARVRRGLGDEAGAASAQRECDDRLAGVGGARYLLATSTRVTESAVFGDLLAGGPRDDGGV